MANEVTINIESSLAAMAYVLAEQQQQIKTLQAEATDWKQKFIEANEGHSNATTENINLRDELKIGARKLEELEKDYKTLSDANMELCEHNTELKDKILEWNDFEAKPFSLKVSEHPNLPCVVLLTETTDDNTWDCDNHRLPIGTKQFVPVWASIKDGYYHLEYNCSGSKVIAWAMIDENNF